MILRAVRYLIIAEAILFGLAGPGHGEDTRFPGDDWERVSPAAGWSKESLQRVKDWSDHIGSTAVMIVQHGAVISEWGDTAAKTPLASVRKSLLSALVGIAVERGELSLSQQIGELGIDDNEPSLSPEEKTATIGDLLRARSGIYHPALYEDPAMAAKRPVRFSHKPGTFWYYNNWDFNALGAIYEHAARSSIFDAFEREIARPIAMQDYVPSDGRYVTGAASVYPAYPIRMSARDLTRFALLYLNDGKWRDRRILPVGWVKESTQPYSQSDLGSGYGYMWWTGFRDNYTGAFGETLPQDLFFAMGYGGQFAFVLPSHDMVIVHRIDHPLNQLASSTPRLSQIYRLLRLILDAAPPPDRL